MGVRTDRITAADFVTPPEFTNFQPLAREESQATARVGGVRLVLADSPTRLSGSYQQIPLRAHAISLGADHPALIYLLNPTAGLFEGDAHLIDIDAAAGTRAVITSQSATRIHPGLHGFATQQWNLRIGTGSVLVVLPGPTIPFQASRYYQRARAELAEGARLIWGDIWLAGRYARGSASERFCFDSIVQDFTVRQNERLIFRDRFHWRGPWKVNDARWHFGDELVMGTLFSNTLLAQDEVVTGGSTRHARLVTASQHTYLRWLGSMQCVTACLAQTALKLATRLANNLSPWLLSGNHLAPTHWFMG